MSHAPSALLEIHLVATLERQNFTRLVGRCDLKAQTLDDLAHVGDLLGIGLRQLAGPNPQGVLKAIAAAIAAIGI